MKIAIMLFTAVTAVCQTTPQPVTPAAILQSGTTCILHEEAPIPETINDITLDNLKCNKHGGALANLYLIDGTGPEGFGLKGSHFGTGGGNKRFGNAWSNSFTAHLTAGPHTLTARYFALATDGMTVGSFGRSIYVTPTFGTATSEAMNLAFAAESGHTYTINAVVWVRFGKRSWSPIVFDVTDEPHPRIAPNQSVAATTAEAMLATSAESAGAPGALVEWEGEQQWPGLRFNISFSKEATKITNLKIHITCLEGADADQLLKLEITPTSVSLSRGLTPTQPPRPVPWTVPIEADDSFDSRLHLPSLGAVGRIGYYRVAGRFHADESAEGVFESGESLRCTLSDKDATLFKVSGNWQAKPKK
jgi:hypothetical protein